MPTGRNRKLLPAELDAAQRALYDTILGGPRSGQPGAASLTDEDGRLEGPFNGFLLQPSLGHALQAVGATLRYESELPDRCREIAILVVAARRSSDFESHVHEPIARSLGVTDEQLAGIRDGDYAVLDPAEAVIARAADEMVVSGDLSDATFAELQASIGTAQVFELTAVVGYYALLALQLRVLRVPLPE
ncbi:carboxymuconolactone decarboxylase family protein [Nocardia sp. NPDC058499]|uniref:carboxymuconolactone decarboxylase family protein n=1 Tax=Nocardia sp. NPDC058499 TaxID=3346530 RepID=UPI00364D0F46